MSDAAGSGISVTRFAVLSGIPSRRVYRMAKKSAASKDGHWKKSAGRWEYFGELPNGARKSETRSEQHDDAEIPTASGNSLTDRFEDRSNPENWGDIRKRVRRSSIAADPPDDDGDDSDDHVDSATVGDILDVVEENYGGTARRIHLPSRMKGWSVPYGEYIVFALAVIFFAVSALRKRFGRGKEQDGQDNALGFRTEHVSGSMSASVAASDGPRRIRDTPEAGKAGGFTTIDY